jgi:hypothetical protein
MTLHNKFEQELAKLGSGKQHSLSAAEGQREIRCQVIERDALAVSFERLALQTAELAGAGVADLERIAKALSARLTYLLEPISPIEIDAEACVVQMRSSPPQRDDDGRSYYELLVRKGGEIALSRFRKGNGAARQVVPATVTREVLVRLAGDFSAAID